MKTSRMSKLMFSTGLFVMMTALSACDKSSGGISILASEENFKVSVAMQPRPVDILWVIDNSGSMESSQANLAANFNSFIQDFVTLKYDYRMAVTTSDVWYEQYNNGPFYSSRWRTGNRADVFNPSYAPQGAPTNSGVFVMDKNTPSINSVFTTNVKVGTQGHGDERSLASLRRALLNSNNNDFRRNGAFLAIIIVSDEDDFSRTTSSATTNYNDPNLIPLTSFIDTLDILTNSTADNRHDNYQISTIAILDNACLNLLNDSSQRKAIRLAQIADLTGGSKNSLCDPFNTVLDNIKQSVITAAAVFNLDRKPTEGSILVKIDGAVIAESPTTWAYDPVTNSVRFAPELASSLSAQANIQITYDPTTLK